MVQHLALVTTEVLPRSSRPSAGGGVRIWGLGESLRRQKVNCTYFLKERLAEVIQPAPDLPIQFYRPELLHQTLRDHQCDAALFEQWQPITFLQKPMDIPVLVDLPGPLILEYYWRDPANVSQHIVHKLNCLAQADYFFCAHPRQHGYYVSWLTWAGMDPAEVDRLSVVPFILHEMPISRFGFVEEEPIFFWGGMFWPWQERFEAFQRVAEILNRYKQGQLVVVGEPSAYEDQSPYQQYADHPSVSWLGGLGYTEYVHELKRATVAVDLCRPTQERLLSSDLRTGTALWAGTPCLVTPESAWAEIIESNNAGWVTAYDDAKAQREIITEITLNRVDIVAKRRGARVVSELIGQDRNTAPLIEWLKDPQKREPHKPFHAARFEERENRLLQMQREMDRYRHENAELRRDLDAIRSHPLFRVYKTMKGLVK